MKKILVSIFIVLFSLNAFAQDYLWDSLRPVSQFAVDIDVPIKMIVFLLSLAIFFISALAYKKSQSKRILLVTIAFLFFALKWLVKLLDIFYSPGEFLSDSSENVFELIILVSLLIALFYKKSGSKLFAKGK
tara:strand:- start:456 stop:851 length:396 start_codon:yes stop_codon:yes gene_type:complete